MTTKYCSICGSANNPNNIHCVTCCGTDFTGVPYLQLKDELSALQKENAELKGKLITLGKKHQALAVDCASIEIDRDSLRTQNREFRKSFQAIIDYIQYHCLKNICRDILDECNKALALQPENANACVWSQDSIDGSWATGCGHIFEINDGHPKENGMNHCCYCGRGLNENPYSENDLH